MFSSHQKIELCLVAEKNKRFKVRFRAWGGPPPPTPRAYGLEISTLEPAFSKGPQIHERHTQKISRFGFFKGVASLCSGGLIKVQKKFGKKFSRFTRRYINEIVNTKT